MKRVLIIIGVVLVVLIAAAVAIPFFVPKATLVRIATEQVEAATGRKLTIGGDPSFSIFPSVALSLSDVSLANAPDGEAPALASIKSVDIEVDLMSAIGGSVVVNRLVLVEPVIAIEKGKDGRFNFEFGEPGKAPAPAAAPSGGGESSGGGGAPALRLDDVRLENAVVTYYDAATGERQALAGINAKVSLPSFEGPFDVEASADWQERTISLTAHVDKPQAIAQGESTALTLSAGSDGLFEFGFNGTASAGNAPQGAGRLTFASKDLAALLAWAGAAPEAGVKLPESVSLSADVTGSPTRIGLADLALGFDANTLTGAVTADIGGPVPAVVVSLKGGDLDFRPYMPADEGTSGSGQADGAATAGGSADWSDDVIDLSALDMAQVSLDFSAGSIRTGLLDTGTTAIRLTSRSGTTALEILELGIYDGKATGAINIDRTGGVPAFSIVLNADGVQAQPALQQFADFGDFLGTVKTEIDLKTAGNTERKLVSALAGKGLVQVTDGAILGYNLAAAVRNVSTGGLDLDYDKAARTDFAEIFATFTATSGVLSNSDFRMNAPLLRVTGEGTVPLPPRQIDYRVLPKLVASLTGQGAQSAGGLGIPVRIRGSWDDPSIQPDLEGVVKGVLQAPGDIVGGAAGAVKGVTEGGAGAVKGLLEGVTGGATGGSTDSGTATPTEEKPASTSNPAEGATKALKGLFGR